MKDRQRKEFQAAWIAAWQTAGDEQAMSHLIDSCMGLVYREVGRAKKWSPVERDDLVSEGVLGIMRAAKAFNALRGKPFSGCAAVYIRDNVLRCAQRQGMPVSFSNSRKEERVQRKIFGLMSEAEAVGFTDREALQYAALELNITEEHAADAISVRKGKAIIEDIEAGEHGVQLAADGIDMAEVIDAPRVTQILREIVDALEPRARRIVEARFFEEGFVSLDVLAAEFSISRERIRQVEVAAMSDLKVALQKRGLSLEDLL
ncbi:RNA polymerase sigma factor for flagellar operon FliA [Cribrihabitans marinus]|uniref:RNA polymerase sigma factor for flagellar operon FliA n=1 Tax=Cribrihabitans marinus TaxID=1227549 RepID=A0A1H6W6C0_9RHOB|nr:sigma-70 family RNA polymerase sigma factor [Cribrihabitans marinus]GGH24580.1 RNA polymerase sigma factor RpoH [Cribrihabitans marinus]SEJ12453.1 RNA polymerase sigma factor for flagellar operon FliA [Cribrihabitans marinus]